MANEEEKKYALLSMMDEAKVKKAFELDTKKDLSEGAWKYFWKNIPPYYVAQDEVPFFNLIHNLDSFDQYEKENMRESSGRGSALLFSQEVFLNMLSVPEAMEVLLTSSKMKKKMYELIHGDNYHFFKNTATSQESLDLLIEHKVLDLSDYGMEHEFLNIAEGDYHQRPGLFACFQAAMRHHAFAYTEEHVMILIKKCWDEMDATELQKWHKYIGEPLCWSDLVLSNKALSASGYQSLSQELKNCISDAHARNFNLPHENFVWLLKLPANYEYVDSEFVNLENVDDLPLLNKSDNENNQAFQNNSSNNSSWNFLADEMPAVIHGMIKSFSPNYFKAQDNLFKNLNAFMGKIKEYNPELYETMCSLAKTLKTEHQECNAKFSKMFSSIVLHESLTVELLSSEIVNEQLIDSQSVKKMKI